MMKIKERFLKVWHDTEVAISMAAMKLREKRGDSNLASIIFVTAVVIVVIVVIFFPQLRTMVEGVFTKSNEKLNSIWNYS